MAINGDWGVHSQQSDRYANTWEDYEDHGVFLCPPSTMIIVTAKYSDNRWYNISTGIA